MKKLFLIRIGILEQSGVIEIMTEKIYKYEIYFKNKNIFKGSNTKNLIFDIYFNKLKLDSNYYLIIKIKK